MKRSSVLRITAAAVAVATSTAVLTSPVPSAGSAVAAAPSGIRPLVRLASRAHWDTPPTNEQCQQGSAPLRLNCFRPSQLQQAYNLKRLYAKGLDGRGSTIVIVDPFGSPTAEADLKTFDHDFGLPDPPHFRVLQPSGAVPAFDPSDPDRTGWAVETSLDVQWAHALAPGADILLVETPVAETTGTTGFDEIVHAENYVVDHRLGDVISQSFGATEETFPNRASLLGLRSAFVNAARHRVPVLAATGDAGPTSVQNDQQSLYTHRVVNWPASDPLVTAVGGTQLHLDADGHRTAPDNAWNDSALLGGPAAGGGGRSHVFARPWYQDGVRRVVHGSRGIPDLSMSAAVDGAVLVWIGFTSSGITPGYYLIGGTSESTPEFAAVVAIARQRAGHRLGLLNPTLYALGSRGATGLPDVTLGDTTVSFTQDDVAYTVPGFSAKPGYDLATGLGTVDAAALTRELARQHR